MLSLQCVEFDAGPVGTDRVSPYAVWMDLDILSALKDEDSYSAQAWH